MLLGGLEVLDQLIHIYIVTLTIILMFIFDPFSIPYLIVRYFKACSSIYNHNRIYQSDILIEKCWVTQSGYFRLITAVVLDMGITDGKLLFCHSI